ncbi:MAG: hypothetical protein F9K22_03730 [Bacteroidetes bacterium]|nr:MAG: hypothetical protein F9K22_03730 [Bacteroidota bacterium]
MNSNDRMHGILETMLGDVITMQNIAIQLSRATYQLHVAGEHREKHHLMKEQLAQLQTRLDRLQGSLVSAEMRTVVREQVLTEVDIAS